MQSWIETSLLGRVIGGYRLDRLLGSGGAGAVFLCSRVENAPPPEGSASPLPAQAAIKILTPPANLGATDQAEFRARFRREAEALRQLQHPHILSVLASGEQEVSDLPFQVLSFMIMPYLAGGTLATRLGQGALSLSQASAYFDQLASALDFAHARQIVHRDIKPANILLDDAGQLYLADFGLVKLFDAKGTTLTTTGQVMGTPEYMSPEQARGEQVGPAADIYSAGVVLYQMVTGHVPFQGKSLVDMLIQIVQASPPTPRQYRPDLPEPAEATILQALAKKAEERFASAGQVGGAFALGLQGRWSPDVRPVVGPTVNVALPATIATPPSAAYQGLDIHASEPPVARPVTPYTAPGGGAPVTPGAGVAVPAPKPSRRRGGLALFVVSALVIVALAGGGLYFLSTFIHGGSSGSHGGGSGSNSVAGITNQQFEIGTDFPISGPNASVGLPAQYGVDLAVSQNSDLGNGNTLSVVHMDNGSATGSSATQGAQNIQSLAADSKVVAVVGPFNSGVAIAEIPVAENSGLTLISPSNTNPALTLSQYAPAYGVDFSKLHPVGAKEYYFRIPANDIAQAKVDALIATSAPISARTAFVVNDTTTYGRVLASAFKDAFTAAGGTVVGSQTLEFTTPGNPDAVAQTIVAANPDMVFFGGVTGGGNIGGATLKARLANFNYFAPMVGGDGIADDPAWISIAGSAAANTYATVAAPDPSQVPQSFVSDYNQYVAGKPNNTLSPNSAMAYDAAMIEIKALKAVIAAGGSVTRELVRDQVATTSYSGVTGAIAFDSNGDNQSGVFTEYDISNANTWQYVREFASS
jgi:serine/threonine protein kinase/ABC-type branched-subunit amino acid transport system substrate-binding protein